MSDATWTDDELRALKAEHAPKATDQQWKVYLAWCRSRGLDPFSGHVRLEVRSWKDKRTGKWNQSAQPMTTIDGYRALAARTGDLDGHEGPLWCGPDGVWREVWLDKAPPSAAMLRVFRKSAARPFTGVARYSEYAPMKDGKPTGLWNKMASLMVAKCAEALALRKAFPEDLSGLYTDEEMDQARVRDADPAPQPNAEPKPGKRVGPVPRSEADVPAPDLVALDKIETAVSFEVWCGTYASAYAAMTGDEQRFVQRAIAEKARTLGVDFRDVKDWLSTEATQEEADPDGFAGALDQGEESAA